MSEEDGWSAVAEQWAASWGPAAGPVHERLLAICQVEAGTAVLDVGCGTGELLAALERRGAVASGVDPAPGMLERAQAIAPRSDVRRASWEQLPWSDGTFDVVFAVNALQFAEDTEDALAEAVRVTRAGGFIAVANWADRALNDLDAIDAALAQADGDEPLADGELRLVGGLDELLGGAGLELVDSGLVEAEWDAANDVALIRGVLLEDGDGDDAAAARETVLRAAEPFRHGQGHYILKNAYRYAVGRVPAAAGTGQPGDDE